MPSEGRQRWHYDTLSSPQPPPALVRSDDCGPPGAVGAWAPPPHPPEPEDLPRDYGPDGSSGRTKPEYTAASGRHDDATFGSGPTRQSDDRDSEPDYLLRLTRRWQSMNYTGTRSQTTCYVRRGTGRGTLLDYSAFLFSAQSSRSGWDKHLKGHCRNANF